MAIWLHFINVLVPIKTIEKIMSTDFNDFFETYNKGIKFHDKHLFATGAMNAGHIEEIVKYFESEGFQTLEIIDGVEYFKDLCVVEALFGGSTRPCKWLEFNASDSSAWLKGTEKGDLVIPDVFKNQNKK